MNIHGHDTSRDDATQAADLRLQLRALRRDRAPGRDLWPQIAARLDAAAPPRAVAPRRARHRAAAWSALAASVCAAIAIGWQGWPDPPGTPAPVVAATGADVPAPLLREADAMTREYDAALLEVRSAGAGPYPRDAAEALDASARAIREALTRDPDSRFLLDRLQRVHAHRLALARRFA